MIDFDLAARGFYFRFQLAPETLMLALILCTPRPAFDVGHRTRTYGCYSSDFSAPNPTRGSREAISSRTAVNAP